MELVDLQIFREVARNQSISRAAAGLHMGQPSVSQRILALEAEVGRALFDRHRRGVRLTQAGARFLEYAERILALAHESVQATRSVLATGPRVRLSAPSTVNAYLLPPLIHQLHTNACDVQLMDAHSHEVMQYVIDGSADAGFVIDTPNQPGIRQVALWREPIVCFAAVHHPLSGRGRLSLADLRSFSIAFYRYSHNFHALVTAVQSTFKADTDNLLEATPVETVKALVREHGYVSFAPLMTISREVQRGELAVLDVTDLPAMTWDISLVHREKKVLSDAVTAVLAAVDALWHAEGINTLRT